LETIFQSIEILSKEKGIDPQIVLDAVKDAMLIAARKHYRTNEDYVADMDPKTGAITLYAVKKVVEAVEDPVHEMTLAEARRINHDSEVGGEIRIPKNTDALGRISAQTAKQVIFQKVREAERETVFNEYSGRTGELVNCTIKRVEGPDYILDLGKTEAKLPKKEQSRLESYSVSDRVRCVIKLVDKASKGPGVIVSRAAPELVMRLFEQEVPEIYDGTVVIRGCAREAGERTKIAVQSRDRDVDSVGACVGMKGMRVQSIIRELRGEKIDIIEYSEDSVVFATHALSPAKVSRISIIDPLEKHMEVIVDDSQLSLAIGKKGQNVRLAAKLLGWKIDIKSEEEKRQEVESQMAALVAPGAPVSVLIDYGLSEAVVEALLGAGIGTIEKLGGMTPEQLQEAGLGEDSIGELGAAVNAYYSQFEEGQGAENPEQTLPEPTPVSPDLSASEEEVAELQGTDTGSLDTEPGPAGMPELVTETNYPPGTLYDPESAEERFEPGSTEEMEETELQERGEQFGTIESAGSPTENPSEGALPEDHAPEERVKSDEDEAGRG
jgi:transcription termination/antitermination protein NusA